MNLNIKLVVAEALELEEKHISIYIDDFVFVFAIICTVIATTVTITPHYFCVVQILELKAR